MVSITVEQIRKRILERAEEDRLKALSNQTEVKSEVSLVERSQDVSMADRIRERVLERIEHNKQNPLPSQPENKAGDLLTLSMPLDLNPGRSELSAQDSIDSPPSQTRETENPDIDQVMLSDREIDKIYLVASLSMTLDRRRVASTDLGKLADALLGLRNDILVQLDREKSRAGWTFYGIGYGSLVKAMRPSDERQGTKREFSSLMTALIDSGYFFPPKKSANRNTIRQIGPRLYPSSLIGEAAKTLSDKLYHFDDLEFMFFAYILAPFHVVLRRGDSIKFTLHQAEGYVRWRQPQSDDSEIKRVSLRIYRRVLDQIDFVKIDRGKNGQSNSYRLSIREQMRWTKALKK